MGILDEMLEGKTVSYTHLASAGDLTVKHIGTGDGADSGCLERLANNRMTGYLLLVYRIQHTLHGSLYILDRLVDDAVQTHVDFLAVRDGLRLDVYKRQL